MITVCHVITGLMSGGAQSVLYKLLSKMDRSRFRSVVIDLQNGGPVRDAIERLGLPVMTLGMRPGWPALRATLRYLRFLRETGPAVIEGWLPHAALLALFGASPFGLRSTPVIWTIHNLVESFGDAKALTRLLIRIGAPLSSRPERIVYNSLQSAVEHERIGYRPDRRALIPIGFDCELFRPNPDARLGLRRELGVDRSTPLVGIVARYDVMKNHALFLAAAEAVAKQLPDAHFVLVGSGVTRETPEFARFSRESALSKRVHFLGERLDMPTVTAAFDVAVLSSVTESFPNVIGEAMACGVPCVATDVGDVREIIDGTGFVVPSRDVQALAEAIRAMLSLPEDARRTRGRSARQRIETTYSLARMVREFEELYEAVATTANARG